MNARLIKGSSIEEIKTSLEECTGESNPGIKPTSATVFISIKQEKKAICEFHPSKDIDVIGATSSGAFIDGLQSEGPY
jgi:hypothetical protein